MKKFLIFTPLAFLLLVAVSYAQGQRRPQHKSIVIFGDSLAVGLGPELVKLSKGRSVGVNVISGEGTFVRQWLRDPSLLSSLKETNPDLIMVSLGTNDARSKDPSVYAEDFRELTILMREAGAATGARILWIAPPDLPNFNANSVWTVRSLIYKQRVPVFHSEDLDIPRCGKGRYHPCNYGPWAKAIWDHIFEAGLI